MKSETIKISGWRDKPEITEDVFLGIKEGKDGYFITKWILNEPKTVKLTNWTIKVEAVVIRGEGERERKVTIKHENHKVTAHINSSALTNTARFREFLLNNCNFAPLFHGTDNDLQNLIELWDNKSEPTIISEAECVGEIPEGFIADNVFIDSSGKVCEITKGLAYINDKMAIQVPKFVTRGGKIAGMPVFHLNEPVGGIDKFKANVFELMIKNRNLKVAIALGWTKATLWSGMFWERKKWFPLFMTHGRKECGKSVLATWIMSMLGMRDLQEISIRKSQYEAGSERHLAYYSSLPVHFCDYRNTENEGQKFHTLFRNIYDRSSVSKGIKNNAIMVRQVSVRGCLLLDGENSPADAGLNSRMITFELTEAERVDKYYDELVKIEPDFNYIGMDWIRNRTKDFEPFMAKYTEIDKVLRKSIPSPRQAQCWAVAIASALTEPYFKGIEERLIGYALRLANHEIKEQKHEETLGSLWEATDILGKIPHEVLYYDRYDNQVKVHLSALLALISSEPKTRNYKLPNAREVAKLLKQEKYVLEFGKLGRCGEKVAKRFILDFKHSDLPEILKHMFDENNWDKPESGNIGDL